MEDIPKSNPRSASKRGGSKYKKIMSHVSKFIHGATSSLSAAKRPNKNKSKVSRPAEVVTEAHNGEPHSSSPVTEELNYEPEYSTIKEITTTEQESVQSIHSIDSPNETSLAPNNIEELYAKVKKKAKKKVVNTASSASLESIPSTSRVPVNVIVHQPDLNCNVTENTAVKEIQGNELHPRENVPEIETDVDELQTLSLLIRHQQQQHTKQASQLKLSRPKKYVDPCRVESRSQKQVTAKKKGVLTNENFPHHSPLNFLPQSSGKPAQCIHYRSLEDISSVVAHKEHTVNKIWQECQEEMMKFQQNMEQVVQENKILHQQIYCFLQKETKWKEEKENMILLKQDNHLLTQKYNVLMQELSALNEQKEKEVKHLSYQVERLQTEKNNLIEKLHSTLHEKETLEIKYSKMCERNSEVIPYEIHAQVIQENQRLLNDMRKKHQEDMDRILGSCRDVENEKNDLSVQVRKLKDDIRKLHQNNTSLKSSLEEVLNSRNLILTQLEQSKQQNLEVQDLLVSLLKLAEEATTEREVALTKAEFQEKQQMQIQGTVVEHSIGIGRLQEHIMNIRRRVSEEMRNVEMSFR